MIRVQVTKEDIGTGRPKVPSACPVALALKRRLPEYKPSVGTLDIIFCDGNMQFRCHLPTNAQNFIAAYDGRLDQVLADSGFEFEIPELAEWEIQ